jgi:transposase-like protein
MRGHGEKLTRKHEALIAALLSGETIDDAARQVGIHSATAYRWLHVPSVQQAYLAARRELVKHAVVQLQSACGEAVQTLREIMTDTSAPSSSRVRAAVSVLELSLRAVEIEDLAERVARLEAERNNG